MLLLKKKKKKKHNLNSQDTALAGAWAVEPSGLESNPSSATSQPWGFSKAQLPYP